MNAPNLEAVRMTFGRMPEDDPLSRRFTSGLYAVEIEYVPIDEEHPLTVDSSGAIELVASDHGSSYATTTYQNEGVTVGIFSPRGGQASTEIQNRITKAINPVNNGASKITLEEAAIAYPEEPDGVVAELKEQGGRTGGLRIHGSGYRMDSLARHLISPGTTAKHSSQKPPLTRMSVTASGDINAAEIVFNLVVAHATPETLAKHIVLITDPFGLRRQQQQ